MSRRRRPGWRASYCARRVSARIWGPADWRCSCRCPRGKMRAAGIRAHLGAGGLALLVPLSTREDAREVLDAQISDEALAEAATAGAGYVRHGVGTVRPYLYGNVDLIEFVQQVF